MLELVLFCLALGWPTAAQSQVTASIAEIKSLSGKVEILKKGEASWEPAEVRQLLYAGDGVRTGEPGEVVILTDDGSGIQINRNSLFVLKEVVSTAAWVKVKIEQIKRSIYQLFTWKRGKPAEAWIVNDNRGIDIDLDGKSRHSRDIGSAEGAAEYGSASSRSRHQYRDGPGWES